MFELSSRNTFCVSLDTRWISMSARLERLGIPCTRWPAVTPDQLDDELHGPFKEDLNPGQRACSASHLTLWRHIWDLGLDYALILEDDILFADDWREQLEGLPHDPSWEAYFLNASEPVYPPETWQKTSHQWFTGAYIVSRLGLLTLLSNRTVLEADLMTWNLQLQGHSYTRFPWPCIQENKDSTTGTDTTGNQEKLERLLGTKLACYS